MYNVLWWWLFINSPSIPSLAGILRGRDEERSPGRLPCPLLHDGFFLTGLDRFFTSPERQIKRNYRWIFFFRFQLKDNNEWACLGDYRLLKYYLNTIIQNNTWNKNRLYNAGGNPDGFSSQALRALPPLGPLVTPPPLWRPCVWMNYCTFQ